ncbi:MAG: LysR family transcriptional regulator, partial [Huintestinicola sp.]
MNLQHLKYMTEVERTGSVTKAAANLFMGQPNLSKAIKEVENEIGITVFRRSAKGVYPTPEGERFLARAKAVLEEMGKLEALYKQDNAPGLFTFCV